MVARKTISAELQFFAKTISSGTGEKAFVGHFRTFWDLCSPKIVHYRATSTLFGP
jgi:hypothetical protein